QQQPQQGGYAQPGYDQVYGQQGGYQQQGYGQQGYGQMRPDEEGTIALAHIGGAFIPLIPIILFFSKSDASPFAKHHMAQATNWAVAMIIANFVNVLLMIVLIGFITYPITLILALVYGFKANGAAKQGEWFTYPFGVPVAK
ncbi:DUF4870 domain-containing protein, partial [Nocardiopsis chromatogenes]|uniref:DUF4870 domain-containing protein n=1 Tax=Nocardiopsis chromatogenes TaxID=280239 RepID=UPI00036E0281